MIGIRWHSKDEPSKVIEHPQALVGLVGESLQDGQEDLVLGHRVRVLLGRFERLLAQEGLRGVESGAR